MFDQASWKSRYAFLDDCQQARMQIVLAPLIELQNKVTKTPQVLAGLAAGQGGLPD